MLSRSAEWQNWQTVAFGLAFHTVCMILGTWMVARAAEAKRRQQKAA